jgi:hypothetical protein
MVAVELLLAWYLLSVLATALADLVRGVVVVFVGNLWRYSGWKLNSDYSDGLCSLCRGASFPHSEAFGFPCWAPLTVASEWYVVGTTILCASCVVHSFRCLVHNSKSIEWVFDHCRHALICWSWCRMELYTQVFFVLHHILLPLNEIRVQPCSRKKGFNMLAHLAHISLLWYARGCRYYTPFSFPQVLHVLQLALVIISFRTSLLASNLKLYVSLIKIIPPLHPHYHPFQLALCHP